MNARAGPTGERRCRGCSGLPGPAGRWPPEPFGGVGAAGPDEQEGKSLPSGIRLQAWRAVAGRAPCRHCQTDGQTDSCLSPAFLPRPTFPQSGTEMVGCMVVSHRWELRCGCRQLPPLPPALPPHDCLVPVGSGGAKPLLAPRREPRSDAGANPCSNRSSSQTDVLRACEGFFFLVFLFLPFFFFFFPCANPLLASAVTRRLSPERSFSVLILLSA